ncbi:sortase [Chloroflexota bacterium]
MNAESEIIPTNRIKRRNIFLLAFVLLVGGLLLPMGVIRAAAEMRQAVYPPATGGGTEIQNRGEHDSSKTNAKGPGEISQATTATVESSILAASAADLEITKTHTADFDVGPSGGTFRIEISNTSTADVFTGSIFVEDKFPEFLLTPVQVLPSGDPQLESCSISGNTVTCLYTDTVVIPAPGSLYPIIIIVDVGEAAYPEVTNIAKMYTSQGTFTAVDTAEISSADLEVVKEVINITPKVKELVTYTVAITNTGQDNTTNVIISDTLPTGIKYQSDIPSVGFYSPSTGRWSGINLISGDSAILTITAEVEEETAGETITNTAEVLASGRYDPDDTNDKDDAIIDVQGTDLNVTKTDGYKYVYPGFIFTYTLTISNAGDISATGVTITDVLGTDYTYISDTDSLTLTEDFTNTYSSQDTYTITPAVPYTFTMKVKVNDPVDLPIDLTNIVTATSTEEKTVTENNTDEDTNILADFDLEKFVSPTSANTGGTLRFTINVKNTGQSILEDIVIKDHYPNVLNIVRTSPSDAAINNNKGTISYTVKSLAINGTSSLIIDTVVNDSARGTITRKNDAIVDAETPDGKPDLPEQTASVSFTIIGTVLPATGGLEADQGPGSLFWVVLAVGMLLGALGLGALTYSMWAKSGNPTWAPWFTTTGLILVAACFIFGFGSFLFRNRGEGTEQVSSLETTKPTLADTATAVQVDSALPTMEIVQFQEPYVLDPDEPVPETLPDYPVPTPTLAATTEEDDGLPDTSSVERIVIPALALDTIVKYVPFSEFTWLIAGLRHEIAWMGDTSWPGLGGNTGLAGHITLSDGSDGPFRHLEELEAGDEVKLYTENNEYTYRVSEKTVVKDTDFSVVEQTEKSQITLITCTGWNQAARLYLERLIIYADLVDTSPL